MKRIKMLRVDGETDAQQRTEKRELEENKIM